MQAVAESNIAPTLQERARGAYLGLAVGDALGATTEFMTPAEIEEKHGTHRDMCGGGWLQLKPGQVTDDTEMSLALGKAILEFGGVDARSIANAFSDWMRSKPVDIGHTVRRGIVHYRSSGEPTVPVNEYDAGNGACMRSLPIALFNWNASEERLLRDARVQSHVTHNNPVSDMGTETVLQMLVSAFNGGDKASMKVLADELAQRHKAYRFDRRRMVNPSGWIVETLQAVFQAFFAYDGLKEILIDVVNRGGDADTTGAIAGMLAGACYGPDAIPISWLKVLDRDVRDACVDQADQLISLRKLRA